MTDSAADLRRWLADLETAGLLQHAIAPDLRYQFSHALIRDAAYQSLVRRLRHAIHLAAAQALEAEAEGAAPVAEAAELAPLLARHYDEAGDGAHALGYYAQAGEAAAQRFANAEALAHLSRALELARQHPPDADTLARLFSRRGRCLEPLARAPEALEDYAALETAGRAHNAPALVLAGLVGRAVLHATPSTVFDRDRALPLAEEALALARRLNDQPAEARILWALMLAFAYGSGDSGRAVVYGEQSLALARALNLREHLPYTLSDLGFTYSFVGRLGDCLALLEESRGLWRELNNLPMLVNNLFFSSLPNMLRGELGAALALLREAEAVSAATENAWGRLASLTLAGMVYLEQGAYPAALEAHAASLALAEGTGLGSQSAIARSNLGWTYAVLGAPEAGRAQCRLAVRDGQDLPPGFRALPQGQLGLAELGCGNVRGAALAIEAGLSGLNPENLATPGPVLLRLAHAELALAQANPAEALARAEALLAFQREAGVRLYASDALRVAARARLALGQPEAAEAMLREAQAQAAAIGSRRAHWLLLEDLAAALEAQGRAAEAQPVRAEAAAARAQAAAALAAAAPSTRASVM